MATIAVAATVLLEQLLHAFDAARFAEQRGRIAKQRHDNTCQRLLKRRQLMESR